MSAPSKSTIRLAVSPVVGFDSIFSQILSDWGGVGRDHLYALLSFKSFQNALNVESVK